MSEKESITTLLTLLESRQARLTAACKEIADWVDHQGPLQCASVTGSTTSRKTPHRSKAH
jgi:hypothetical protein